MVCFRYVTVNIQYKGHKINNNNNPCVLTQQLTGKLRNHQYKTHTYIHTYIHTYKVLSAGLEEYAENSGTVAGVTVPISVTTYHAYPRPTMFSSRENIQILPLASA